MSNMLNRSATFLGIRIGSTLDLAKSAVARRNICQESPSQPEKPELMRCDVPKQYTVEDFKHLLKSEEDAKKCRLILLEIRSLREETGQAADEILERDIRELLSQSPRQRHRYYSFMFKREMSKKNSKLKRNLAGQARKLRLDQPRGEQADKLYPFLRKNSQFKVLQGRRLMEAALFGQKIFFDFGFNDDMNLRERRNLIQQFQFAYGANRAHPRPFDLNVCNIDKNSDQMELLRQHFATEDPEKLLIGTTEKSYLDLCPKEELIYLSPDSPNPLEDWDHSANFIIGGIIDRSIEKPLTLAKAKKEGIRCARLPIHECVLLKEGAQKTLTLNQVIDILLIMRETNDWKIAFEKLPKRFTNGLFYDAPIDGKLIDFKTFESRIL